MTTVRLVKSGETFEVELGETILDAAERAGIFLPHNCRSGTCRTCITRVLSGRVEHIPGYVFELNIGTSEIAAGYRLLCSSTAHSDAELDC